ncbi:hypothetical protein ACQP00_31050 [Dactylosporangium sp. CS-047395]|uniref:hypothetical protein n=1 Tax=Dactylosporangium sp. CS-047395 TaxID=3239936 RepID=UPI003D92BC12
MPVADEVRDARSGDIIAGDFVEYRRQWRPGLEPGIGKLYWIPSHPAVNARMTITATSATGRVETYDAGSLATNEGGVQFYPSGIPLPSAGTWKLVAEAGGDWGCFELTLH